MEIYINEKKTDFVLENEKNSFDIITAISNFAVSSNPKQFITCIKINNHEYSYADENTLKNIGIEEIQQIKIETSDVYGITSSSIEQVEKFLKLLKEVFVNKEWNDSLIKVNDSLTWMKEGVNQIINIYDSKEENLGTEKTKFIKTIDILISVISKINLKDLKNYDMQINEIIKYIDELILSFSNIKKWLIQSYRLPDKEYLLLKISNLINQINDINPKLANIPLLFQTGEDKEAMDTIQNLTTILEESIGLFIIFKENFNLHMDKYTIKENASFDDFFKIFSTHLKELMEAIKNNDSVMIGDLLEYEFVPNLEEIKNILIKIKDEAFIKAN